MAIKGSQAKIELFQQIMKLFPGSFMYNDNKELRVNMTEEGVPVQIKVTLTAAKTPVEPSESNLSDTNAIKEVSTGEYNWEDSSPMPKPTATIVEPTEEEKERVAQLVKALNF